jgi:hypothetical protein
MEHLTILNVGHGDTKLTFDKKKPAERKHAQQVVSDMLKLGYAICVKEGDRWVRATSFDPHKNQYLIKSKGKAVRHIPAGHTTRAVSVARSAGGMSVEMNSIERENLRTHDKLHPMREKLRMLADHVGEWAGIPMPLEGQPLIIDPKYPCAKVLTTEHEPLEEGVKLRNQFYSHRYRGQVLIWQEADGSLQWGIERCNQSALQLQTLGASYAWGIEQEAAALNTLAELVPHHTFKCYLLSGMFLETSQRSGVTYTFRKLRPTLALRPSGDSMRVIAALCMHPIAYYDGSWAGAMCPTDDVIAHLMLMRADERLYWRRCNQHPADRVEAGL